MPLQSNFHAFLHRFCEGTEQKEILDVNCDCNGENCKINIAGATRSSLYESALC